MAKNLLSFSIEKWPHDDLVFTAPTEKGLEKYADVEKRIADFNDEEGLVKAFSGVDTMILISMPFVGPKRRAAQKTALDVAVKAGVKRLVYTSIVGAGEPDIDTYEVNDHVWFEAYVNEQTINVLANNMGDGKMAYISRDDCALACACAAMSDLQDRVIDVNGAELLTIGEYIAIANEVNGHNVKYVEIDDEQQYTFFDSIGVPRTTDNMWAQTATNFPFCSDGMVTFGRAIRQNQMATFTNDFEMFTGQNQ